MLRTVLAALVILLRILLDVIAVIGEQQCIVKQYRMKCVLHTISTNLQQQNIFCRRLSYVTLLRAIYYNKIIVRYTTDKNSVNEITNEVI